MWPHTLAPALQSVLEIPHFSMSPEFQATLGDQGKGKVPANEDDQDTLQMSPPIVLPRAPLHTKLALTKGVPVL